MAYAFYETNFNDPTVELVCLHIKIIYAKNREKKNKSEIKSSNRTKLFDGYKRKITI
ncbi:hypothetical protein ACE6H2_015201 [Prunus campanulata]